MAEEKQPKEEAPEAADDAPEAPEKKAPPEPTAEEKVKQALKAQIKTLRSTRDEKRAEWTRSELDKNRRHVHRLRRKLRKLTKAAG